MVRKSAGKTEAGSVDVKGKGKRKIVEVKKRE